jgi:NAD(P)-dependent dehydrogenase (short-subunit alcohol dehydrogenase family)
MKLLAITGAAQGIGRCTAQHFARHGYAISFCDVDAKAGAEALAGLEALNAKVLFQHADVSREADIHQWVERTVAELGTPTVVINNAGIAGDAAGPFEFLEHAVADFDRILATNLRSVFLVSQAFARHMIRGVLSADHDAGCVINIASVRAFHTEANWEAYSASKGGILGLTHSMALSLGPRRIRVNSISPGWIEVGDWKRSDKAKEPKHTERERKVHPVGRIGVPQDIADACWYLAEYAGFTTGANLVIDGGLRVQAIYD